MFILAWMAGAKRGGGGGGRKSPIPSFSPSTLSPTRFDACYAGFVHDWSLPGNRLPNKRRKSAEDEVAQYSSASLGYRGF